MLGVYELYSMLKMLENTDNCLVAVALLDAITGRNSARIEAAVKSTRTKFPQLENWICTTFALLERGLEYEFANKLAASLGNSRLDVRKSAQIGFRLAGQGNRFAKYVAAAKIQSRSAISRKVGRHPDLAGAVST
jgi:hypothetical protein